ncbi:MAG: hypothetical protein EXQ81_05950 [Thermoleophilia bacterium]|nr:hypothetical protein [Thermoleophilia bacterium]
MPIGPLPPPGRSRAHPADDPHDVWALGADLEPGTLLAAYRRGTFPMRVDANLVWWSPPLRAMIPVAGFAASRSLRRAARGYEVRIDTAFGDGFAGGLYGIGDLFAAESRVHRRTGASQAALLALILHPEAAGGTWLLDVQWATPHRRTLGAVEVERGEYRPAARRRPAAARCVRVVGRVAGERPTISGYDSRPMSFVSPIAKSSKTSPMPTIDTRS